MHPSDIALLIGGPLLASVLLFEANREQKIHLERRGLFRFPTALLLSTIACLGTGILYAKVNPYVIYSYPNAVFFSLFALGFIVLYAVLAGAARYRPTPHQTTSVLGELFLVWWIILAIDVQGILFTRALFYVPFLYLSALIGLAAMLLQAMRPPPHHLPGVIRLPEEIREAISEHVQHHGHHDPPKKRWNPKEIIRSWNLDLRRVTIIGVTIITQLGFFIVLMVMKNKWIRYQQPLDILLVDATSALFLVLPFATFMHKLHWPIPSFFSLVFIGTFFFSLFIFPFTNRAPAFLEFSQRLSLDNGTNVVRLTGPKGYTEYDIVPHLPSFKTSEDLHFCKAAPMGLAGQPASSTCVWHGLPPPEPPVDLLNIAQYHLFGPAITVVVSYAPGCTGYGLEFQGSSQPKWEGISRSEETSGRVVETFKVWVSKNGVSYTAKASCVWNALKASKVPAFIEAESFSPRWARVRGDAQALVIAERMTEIGPSSDV
ncbi:hypothetical protein FRC14_002691 [Serendipita sp. 396]|nr:hypothetical protein FRC14_002691 [Serendipita sp. 396]KAG8784213.1 hypothetical protein FRC15_003714 [Serendipita sp. 397]KAG8823172.1 hypothetical protein FRC19_004505 [Serendipita sp. 401]KAG8833507.1 hypothetical protein FRC18_003495 [Serendipita sp. 400]KAG8853702.1 hypothetical protein FRB91_004502 [Serendipita sp. 411]KAG9055823.1 hypothetical protein FS842_001050 [Serendipita sp. 407]